MLRLGVNIDHVATLRQARGTLYPDVVSAAGVCEKAGADGITVHLREDRRHIQNDDVIRLRLALRTRLNLEMACSPAIVTFALGVGPDEVCLVPEKRQELTTEGGLDVIRHFRRLEPVVRRLRERGIVVSIFVDPEPEQLDACARMGAPCIELHTGSFCNAGGRSAGAELRKLVACAKHGKELGLQINAGHGINLDNIAAIMKVPHLDTLNIGHSIVSDAVFVGLENAVRAMLKAMRRIPSSGE